MGGDFSKVSTASNCCDLKNNGKMPLILWLPAVAI